MFDKKTINKIREASATMEKAGKLSPFVLELIYKERLFKLFIPEESGGRMLFLPEALQLFDEAARIDGNLGWAVTIGSGGGYFYGYMQPKIAHNLFKDRKAVVAGSGHPSAIAEKVKGGYTVTGQWKYASGAPYATVFTANALIKGTNGMLAFAFNPKQVTILKDWNAVGMRATESHSFKVNKAFVYNEMTFDLSKALYYENSIYQYPFLQFAETSFAALTIGIGRHFIEEAENIINYNKKAWSGEKLSRHKFVKEKLDRAKKSQQKAIDALYSIAEKSWKQVAKQGKLQAALRDEVSNVSRQTSRVILANADNLFQYLGMQAVMEDSTINRIWRDLHTACQHVLLIPFK